MLARKNTHDRGKKETPHDQGDDNILGRKAYVPCVKTFGAQLIGYSNHDVAQLFNNGLRTSTELFN